MTPAPVLGTDAGAAQARWLFAADRVKLRALFWPREGARGTVLMLTGRTEHAEKFGPTAARLAAAGYASAAIDWRGQGLSQRLTDDPRKGHVGRFSDYQLDLAAFVAASEAFGLPGPRYMLAHSMGGCIGLRALLSGSDFAAAAFSAPMWGILVPGGRDALFARLLGTMARAGLSLRYAPPPASGPLNYLQSAPFAGNTLTTDPEAWGWMRAQLAANPELVIAGPTIGWTAAALAECRALARLPSPALPCLTGLGGQERIVNPAAIESRMAHWPGGTLLRLPGAQHELLKESPALRDRFLSAAIALFDGRIPPGA